MAQEMAFCRKCKRQRSVGYLQRTEGGWRCIARATCKNVRKKANREMRETRERNQT